MAKLTEQEVRSLKSAVYNANSVMQHLRVRVEDLEQKVEFLRRANSRMELDLKDVVIGLREKRIL